MIGTLQEMSAVDLVQITCVERQTARLVLTFGRGRGEIWFEEGWIVHAETGGLTGKPALFELLAWDRGDFELELGLQTAERTVHQSHSLLLLEAAEHVDRTRLAGPDVDRVVAELDALEHFGDGAPPRHDGPSLARLVDLPEVTGGVLVDGEGQVLAARTTLAPAEVAAMTVLVGDAARQLGAALGLGAPRHAAVECAGRGALLVLPARERWVTLALAETAATDLVARQAEGALR